MSTGEQTFAAAPRGLDVFALADSPASVFADFFTRVLASPSSFVRLRGGMIGVKEASGGERRQERMRDFILR